MTAMSLRVVVEHDAPTGISGLLDFMDLAGPLLIAVTLVLTTYYTRSLVPAAMAVLIVIVLFPEMRADLRATFPERAWGSGLGSAASALIMAGLCFYLRRAPFLQKLGEGDLYMGRTPFPLRRHDSTLFTGPLLAAILFLAIKVETWNFLRNITSDGLGLRTSMALVVTSAVWLLVAAFRRQGRAAALSVH
jgi:hypothetical protein